ncbi:hypothetical protein FACS1894120_2750 [Clostridia bacterium]|nr:hypothetical protein FACS1894120_2750 [Clostridia bacterium]
MLHNTMEILVNSRLEALLKGEDGICKCETCLDDIRCLALNRLQPKYVSSDKGELFSMANQLMVSQHKTDVDFAVLFSINKVKERPRHLPANKK